MKKVREVDHAIFLALMAYGTLRYNELCRKSQEFGNCHIKSFNFNLKDMVSDKLILKRKIRGKQFVEYSINHDISQPILEIVNWLENVITESQKVYYNLEKEGKLLAEAKKLDQKLFKKYLSGLELTASMISRLLEATKWYPVLIKLGDFPKIVENKLNRLQKAHLEIIDRILNLLPTLDPEIYANLLSLIVKKMKTNLYSDALKSS